MHAAPPLILNGVRYLYGECWVCRAWFWRRQGGPVACVECFKERALEDVADWVGTVEVMVG